MSFPARVFPGAAGRRMAENFLARMPVNPRGAGILSFAVAGALRGDLASTRG